MNAVLHVNELKDWAASSRLVVLRRRCGPARLDFSCSDSSLSDALADYPGLHSRATATASFAPSSAASAAFGGVSGAPPAAGPCANPLLLPMSTWNYSRVFAERSAGGPVVAPDSAAPGRVPRRPNANQLKRLAHGFATPAVNTSLSASGAEISTRSTSVRGTKTVSPPT